MKLSKAAELLKNLPLDSDWDVSPDIKDALILAIHCLEWRIIMKAGWASSYQARFPNEETE